MRRLEASGARGWLAKGQRCHDNIALSAHPLPFKPPPQSLAVERVTGLRRRQVPRDLPLALFCLAPHGSERRLAILHWKRHEIAQTTPYLLSNRFALVIYVLARHLVQRGRARMDGT